ncbi:MAG: excinuclease ABC subunit UvrC [Bacteroidota bacterium]|nr:excinuclease ABC subunit UvrC [Bacteroidota bacterium]
MTTQHLNKNIDILSLIIKTLPEKPGIYQYFDDKGAIIYIGKAKNLKKRVSSYFMKTHDMNNRIKVLVKKISDIKFIVVDTEMDALLLENNLIKKYQPRYNVLLKDDKTYPWICIKNEVFPRIFSTRTRLKDGSEYFGPYASLKTMNTILGLIHQLYPLRTCKHLLSSENIAAKKFKVCLNYHIGKCKGPCEGFQKRIDYDSDIDSIRNIIKGHTGSVIAKLKEQMMGYADKMEFEKAQLLKEKIEIIKKHQSKSTVVSPVINNIDVFSIVSDEKAAFVNFLKVVNGAIIQSDTMELKKKLDESDSKLLTLAITELRRKYNSDSTEIIVPIELDITETSLLNIAIPQIGDKKHLLDLSEKNAKYFRLDKQKRRELIDPERHSKRILNTLKKDLRMSVIPERIECFDNSNFQGDYPVAAMVQFRKAKPYKKEYRHYNIKTVVGPDDYASMEEVIYRRYKRLLEENLPLPQLIVVDGGKGQLGSALKSLEKLNLRSVISIIGIAKRLEEIYFPGDSIPLYLDKTSESLKLIQHLRDEAHRFGITHHRNKRDKGTLKTELTSIKGIGLKTANELLQKFRSIKRIKEVMPDDLAKEIGNAKAQIVFDYFQKKRNE